MDHIARYFTGEAGAITVDWVVLTAACLSLGLGAVSMISGSVRDVGLEANGMMSNYEIDHHFDTEEEIQALQAAANVAAN
ncbi:hypothetical protein N8I71_00040 [Roseibacterium sp. SDUM158016]|uniref:hypothetical protein n=1 Tax=Roseicyclus sediminis TaxID=2980997 RepID=UPI0021D3E408|nr:hypothetical protein [Roseibacterium sp. SDUM158016]MCU4651203.1 hypothetical protein [Roseibacterium sp. SDUM158016]